VLTSSFRLTNEQITTSPTIGSNVEEVVWKNIHFICWDLAGQTSFQKSWSTYYMNTNFVMVVVDSADRDRLPIIKEQLYNILIHDVSSDESTIMFLGLGSQKSFTSHLCQQTGP
jgi:GTPase SAR1 family protein